MPSNSVFFGLRAIPPLQEVGWEVRVLSYEDYETPVAVISEYKSLMVNLELNKVGGGSITLDLDSPFWSRRLANGDAASTLKDREYLWECYEDGELRWQFLGQNVEETLLEESETRAVTISGPGPAEVLNWARIMPPNFPTQQPEGALRYQKFAPRTAAMKIFRTLLIEAQNRGAVPWVNYTFTNTHDSAGVVWADVATPFGSNDPIKPDLGRTMLEQLNIATGQDLDQPAGLRAEWFMWPGFLLDVRPTIGVHRDDEVRFFEGGTVLKQRTRLREDIANYIAVRDYHGDFSFVTNSASIAAWQHREQLEQKNPLTDPVKRDRVAQVYLEQRKDERSSWTITVPYRETGRKVFDDYGIGDWIAIVSYDADGDMQVDKFRVMGITVEVTGSAEPTLELTLESTLDVRLKRMEERLTAIYNTTNITNTGPGSQLPPTNPGYPSVPVWNPDDEQWHHTPLDQLETGGGIKVFIQPDDPGSAADTGDFWFQTP